MNTLYIDKRKNEVGHVYIRDDHDFVAMVWDLLGTEAGKYVESIVDRLEEFEEKILILEQELLLHEDAYHDGYEHGYSCGYDDAKEEYEG